MDDSARQRYRGWLLIPLLLAMLALGTHALNQDYLRIDEYYSVGNAGWLSGTPYSPDQVWGSVAHNSPEHAPGYFMLLADWAAVAGWSPYTLRVLSLFFSLLTIAATYQTGRTWFSHKVGLYAAMVVGLGAFFMHFSREIRMYTLLALWTAYLLWIYAHIVLNKHGSLVAWMGLLIGVLGMLYTHYYGVPILVALGLYHVLFVPRDRHWLLVLAVMTLAGVLFIPWGQVVRMGVANTTESYGLQTHALSPMEIVHSLFRLFSNGNGVLLALVAGLSLVSFRVYRQRAWIMWFLLAAALGFLILVNLLLPNMDEGRIRYLIFLWPLLAVMVGQGVSVVEYHRSSRWAVLLLGIWLLFGVASIADSDFLGFSDGNVQDYPPLIAMRDDLQPLAYRHDLLISFTTHRTVYKPGKFNIPADFYLEALPADRYLVTLGEQRTESDIRQELQNTLRPYVTIWLVTEPSMTEDSLRIYRESLEERYTLCDTPVNNQVLRIERYDLAWFDCQSRTIPPESSISFEDRINLQDVRWHSESDG